MKSTWHFDRESMDQSLAVLSNILGKLRAANDVDMVQIIQQLEAAAECARSLREWVSAELPQATWENRAELDAVLQTIESNLEAKAFEQLRSRLFAMATELESGKLVHRRALRLAQLNQLREQAIHELLDHAGAPGAPEPLPGPDPERWIAWACELKDPEDSQAIGILRSRFPHLDEFVANISPEMWVGSNDEVATLKSVDAQEAPAKVEQPEPPAVAEAPARETKSKKSKKRAEKVIPDLPPEVSPIPESSSAGDASTAVVEEEGEPTQEPEETTSFAQRLRRLNPFRATGDQGRQLAVACAVAFVLVLAAWWMWHRKHAIDVARANVDAANRMKSQALLHRLPAEGSQDRILLTMESCQRVDPVNIKCWGYVANQREKDSDVSLSRADVVDGKGNSFNLSGSGQYDFATGLGASIPAYSTLKYTLTIPDKDPDAQMLTLYLDAKNPRDVEYTFRDIPVAQ